MSIKAIGWAFKQKCGTPAEKLVLLALADYANDEGECWPGQDHIAEKTDLVRETVLRLLRSLEKQSLIISLRKKDDAGRDLGKRYFLQFCPPGVTNNHIPCDNYAAKDGVDVTSHIRCGTVIEPSMKQEPGACDNFKPDRITSDTPLPPVLQAEWDRITEVYPKPRGIIKGRDRAVRLFVKSAERARILRNAGHYSCSSDAKSGFVMGLDKFVEGGYRDYDFGEQPLGREAPAPDRAWAKERERDEAAAAEFERAVKAGEIAATPRARLPHESEEEYARKVRDGTIQMVRVGS
jgi:hypothetical protein